MVLLSLVASISSCSASGYDDLNSLASDMYGKSLGDCWGCADYAGRQLAAWGYPSAIVQGTSDAGVSNHRAVRVNVNGNIVLFESQCANWRGYWQRDWFVGGTSNVGTFNYYDNPGVLKELGDVGFDNNYYLNKYVDVRNAGIRDSRAHYIKYGRYENRYPNQYVENIQFDRKYYLDTYVDVRNSGLDPAVHYLEYGKNEGRYANQILADVQFNRQEYLDLNPDVAAAGMDPTEHYMIYGRFENRPIHVDDKVIYDEST